MTLSLYRLRRDLLAIYFAVENWMVLIIVRLLVLWWAMIIEVTLHSRYHQSNLQYTLADVVKAIDGDKIFNGCGLGLKQCSEKSPCPIHNDFKKIRAEIFELLQRARLGEFNELLEKKLAVLKR